MVCPNINSTEWKALESAVGKNKAYSIFRNNGYEIPSMKVIEYLSQAKVSEREMNWIKRNLPKGLSVNIFETLVLQSSYGDSYVWGQFKDKTLNLSSLAEKGTGYHEYFHGIFRNYLEQEEIDGYLQLAANEIDKILDKKNISIRDYIADKYNDFIDLGLDQQEKINLLYEEHLAENFAKYMNKKEYNNIFEKLFDALRELIRFIFNNQRTLDLLFHKIANGDFRNGRVATNKYQEGYLQDNAYVRKIYKKPFKDKDGDIIRPTYGIEESQQIIRDISKIYYSLKNSDYYSKNKFNSNELLEKALDIMTEYANEKDSELSWVLDKSPRALKVDKVNNITERKYIKDTAKAFIKSISPYFNFSEDVQVDLETSDENENGDPQGTNDDIEVINPRNDSFGKESAEKQGWGRLPQFLREYISTSSYLELDEDGDAILIAQYPLPDGSILPIYKEKTIDVNKIYYSLTRSLIDTPNDITRLVKMYEISRGNSNQKAFVDRFFKDANLDITRLDEMEATQSYISRRYDGSFTLADITLIQSVVKGFDKYTQDPLMMAIDTDRRKTTVGLANRNNASIIFYEHWKSNFESQMFSNKVFNDNLWKSIDKNLDVFIKLLSPTSFTSIKDVSEKARKFTNELSKLGIDVSPSYIEYSIAYNLKASGKLNNSVEGTQLKTKLKRIKLERDNIFKEEDIKEIFRAIRSQGNPFEVVESTTENSVSSDSTRRIMNIAKGNVKFDEAAYETSYIASDGTMRYGHQDATLHLLEVNKMNDGSYLEKVLSTGIRDEKKGTIINGKFYQTDLEDADFRKNSIFNQEGNGIYKLLKDGQSINFVLRPADGLKEDYLGTNDEGQTRRMTFTKKGESDGVHFGDMTDRDYAIYMLNLPFESYETQDIHNENGETVERIFFSPVSLGMMETSKTHHFLYAPTLRNLYGQTGMTDNSIQLLSNEIEKEYNRMRKVAQQLQENGEFITMERAEQLQDQGKLPFIYSGYHHSGGNFSKGRALKFSDFVSGFISSDLQATLNEAAIRNQDLFSKPEEGQSLIELIKEDLPVQFENLLNNHIQELKELGIIQEEKSGKITSELLSSNFFIDDKGLEVAGLNKKEKLQAYGNIRNGFRGNLAHLILQQSINSINALHIINGDPALMYKADGAGTDFYKRMKTSNGAGISASHKHNYLDKSEGFDRFNAIVLEEPKVASKFHKNDKGEADSIDVADAQMYMNIKVLKHVLLGLGKLSEPTANLIVNKIEKGIPLTKEDLFESGVVIEQDRFINPYKFIFRDPSSTFKISAYILTQNLVETNVGTEENPDWKPAKDREDLHEIYSLMNNKNIDFAVFETGSKTMTANVLRKKDGKYDTNRAYPISYSADYLRLQLENPTNKTHITTPTQLIQAIDTEQDSNAKGYIDGVEIEIGEIRDLYNQALADKHNSNYLGARNSMYTIEDLSRDLDDSIKNGIIVPKLVEFQNRAVKGLLDSGADSQLVDFFRTTQDSEGNEIPQFDLNNPKTIEKYTNLWYSYMSSGVFSMKNSGFAAALVSSYGFKPIKKITAIHDDGSVSWKVVRKNSPEYKIIHKKDLDINQINYSDEKTFKLLAIGEDSLESLREKLARGETIYFKDRLQYGVPRYENGVVTGQFAEVLFPNHHPDLNDNGKDIPDAVKYMFGNRIPLQDKHSMMNFELVDYLPMEYGSSLVAPQEIVEFSGADYDIDKVYITVPPIIIENGEARNYYLGEDMNQKYNEYLHYMYDENKQVKKLVKGSTTIEDALSSLGFPSSVEEYENYLNETGELNNGVNERIIFESMTTLYSNQSMIDRGIPMSPANQEKLKALQDHPYFKKDGVSIFGKKLTAPALSPLQLIRQKRANNVGKDNIGIIVNINKVFTTLNKANASINNPENYIGYNGKYYSSFGNSLAMTDAELDESLRIIDYLSTLTSAATDEAKDSNCAKFGLGIEEMKVAGVLLSLGMNIPDVVLLVNQPIIKTYTKLLESDNYVIKSKNEEQNSLSREEKQLEAFKLIGATNEDVEMVSLDSEKLSNILFGIKDKDFSIQQSAALKLFLNTLKLNEQFSAVATIMKMTNGIDSNSIDNIKRAKNTLEIGKPKEEEMILGLRYALTGDERYDANNNYVNQLAAANINNLTEIEKLNNITFLTNLPAFKNILKELGSIYSSSRTEDRKQFEKDLLSYLTLATYKSLYFNPKEGGNPNFKSGFIYEIGSDESIVDKFSELKNKINTDPDYAYLKNNPLLNQLLAKSAVQKIKDKNGKIVIKPSIVLQINELITRTTSKKNEFQQGAMTLGFLELLDDPNTSEFADALLDFELIKDGLQFQFQTIGSIFPVDEYRSSLGYKNSAIEFVRMFMSAKTNDDFKNVVNQLVLLNQMKDTYDFNVDKIDFSKKKSSIRNDISKLVYGMSWKDFVNEFYKLKFTNAKSFKKIRSMNLDSKMIKSKESPYRLDASKKELKISFLAGTNGLKGEAAVNKIKSNESTLLKARFDAPSLKGDGKVLYYPRYFKSYIELGGESYNYLFEYQEDQKLRYQIEELENDLDDLNSNYEEDFDYRIDEEVEAEFKDEIKNKIAALKKEIQKNITYKIVKVIGSPKVSPFLNPEGTIPTATAYKKQERVLNRISKQTEEIVENIQPVDQKTVDIVIPDFTPEEVREEVKGPIESSLPIEEKQILNIGVTPLNFGDPNEVIKNKKC